MCFIPSSTRGGRGGRLTTRYQEYIIGDKSGEGQDASSLVERRKSQ